jgi:hypothetical protein
MLAYVSIRMQQRASIRQHTSAYVYSNVVRRRRAGKGIKRDLLVGEEERVKRFYQRARILVALQQQLARPVCHIFSSMRTHSSSLQQPLA